MKKIYETIVQVNQLLKMHPNDPGLSWKEMFLLHLCFQPLAWLICYFYTR